MLINRMIEIGGTEDTLYHFFNYISYWAAFAFLAIWNIIKRKELDPEVNYVYIVAKSIGILSIFFFMANWMNGVFGDWFEQGHRDYFGTMYTSVLMLIPGALVFLSAPLKRQDYYAPVLALILAFFKTACYCAGCCYGKACPWGVYNFKRERYEYPVQMTELIIALIICVVLILYVTRWQKKRGTAAPLYIILYSATRFLTEFMRGDFERIWGILTPAQLECIAGLIIGFASFKLMEKYGEKIDDFFEAKFAKPRSWIFDKIPIILTNELRQERKAAKQSLKADEGI